MIQKLVERDRFLSPWCSINRYLAAPYNLLSSQTNRQDLVTFFPLCFTINGTNSFEYVSPAKGREKRIRTEKDRGMQTETSHCRGPSTSTRCLKGYLLLCELDFVDCARLKNSGAAFIAEEPISWALNRFQGTKERERRRKVRRQREREGDREREREREW